MRNVRNNKGFTLIELMIVVVIIGILAALAIPRFSNASDRAKEKEADGILKQIYTIQEVHHAANGGFTADVAALTALGYQAPTALKHYGAPTITATDAVMAPSGTTPTHCTRTITYATGNITSSGTGC
jgi:prepilin-type N-terminal cleavage/methylation domain-containing protein